MNTTISTALFATLGIFMFSHSCFGQDNRQQTFSVLEKYDYSLNEVDSDPGIESMLLTPVEDSDVETYADRADPDNHWEEFKKWFRCVVLKGNLDLALEREEYAFSEMMSTILDLDSSLQEKVAARRRWGSAVAAVIKAQEEWDDSGCGCAR